MNTIWHFLREFESKDLVKKYIKGKYDFELNSGKAYEISSAFKQGRSYFESVLKSDISVKPVLQYYGIVALSRGLIMILDKNARENNIKPSHGLKIKNWSDINASGKLEQIIIKTSQGTFRDLIEATENKSYFRHGSSGINFHTYNLIPQEDFELNLKELSYSFPDLKKSVESWLVISVPSKEVKTWKTLEGKKCEISFKGKGDIEEILPSYMFKNKEITETTHTTDIIYEWPGPPHLCQFWEGALKLIGNAHAIPPFNQLIFLNDISKMFAVSFIFGSISRYYPTTWNNINSGIKNDSVLPFVINLMDFLQEKYPQIVMDFINSPYDYETK